MSTFLRSMLSVLAGFVAGYVVITVFETVGTLLYPLPAGIDPTDMDALRAVADQIPIGAFVFVVCGWGVGALTGSWVAGRVANRSKAIHGGVVAGLLVLGGLFTLFTIPHPVWVWVVGLAALIGGGYLGSRLAARAAL